MLLLPVNCGQLRFSELPLPTGDAQPGQKKNYLARPPPAPAPPQKNAPAPTASPEAPSAPPATAAPQRFGASPSKGQSHQPPSPPRGKRFQGFQPPAPSPQKRETYIRASPNPLFCSSPAQPNAPRAPCRRFVALPFCQPSPAEKTPPRAPLAAPAPANALPPLRGCCCRRFAAADGHPLPPLRGFAPTHHPTMEYTAQKRRSGNTQEMTTRPQPNAQPADVSDVSEYHAQGKWPQAHADPDGHR